MSPDSSLDMDEMEFEKEIKRLEKTNFLEFRKKFREFSSFANQMYGSETKDGLNENLKLISRKLHLIKKENERREIAEKTHAKIQEILKSPELSLKIEDPDFKEVIHDMESHDFKTYLDHFKEMYLNVLNDRKKIIQMNTKNVPFDKKNRENLKVIKRWDVLEEEWLDREKRAH